MSSRDARGERIRAAIGAEALDRRKTEVHSIRLTQEEGDLLEQACIESKTLLVNFMHDAVMEKVARVLG